MFSGLSGGRALAFVCSCAVLGGYGFGVRVGDDGPDDGNVVIRDEAGRPRVRLGQLPDGAYGMSLMDEHGESVVQLFSSADQAGWIVRVPESGLRALTVLEHESRRGVMGMMGPEAKQGVFLEHIAGGLARVVVLDGEGRRGVTLEDVEQGRGLIILRNGVARAALADSGESVGLAVWDDGGVADIRIQRKAGEEKSTIELGNE